MLENIKIARSRAQSEEEEASCSSWQRERNPRYQHTPAIEALGTRQLAITTPQLQKLKPTASRPME